MRRLEDYRAFSLLKGLPKLIRAQRRLVRQIHPIEPLIEREKEARKEIALRLIAAGIPKGAGVTCAGYDVVHCGRKGHESYNADRIIEAMVAVGVERGKAIRIMIDGIDTGEPSFWVEIDASPDAKVRA